MATQTRPEMKLTDQSMIGWYSLTCLQRAAKASDLAMENSAQLGAIDRNRAKCSQGIDMLLARQNRVHEMIETLSFFVSFSDRFPIVPRKIRDKLNDKRERAMLLYERIETQIQILSSMVENYELEEKLYDAKLNLLLKKLHNGDIL